jgi:hypothetical protein
MNSSSGIAMHENKNFTNLILTYLELAKGQYSWNNCKVLLNNLANGHPGPLCFLCRSIRVVHLASLLMLLWASGCHSWGLLFTHPSQASRIGGVK